MTLLTSSPIPQVTIVVSPRERFSHTQQTLESLYTHTQIPFELVYVDGASPKEIQTYLLQQAQKKGFILVRSDRFLSPNQARNLALPHVKTPYVLFIDNDVVVTPGWLEKLLTCATETQATIVCPLTCIGEPIHQTIHLAGGEARIILEVKGDRTRRKVHEKHYFVNRPVAEVQHRLKRQQCEFAEFHCMLVKTAIFEKIGPLDEKLLSTREHIDFCMSVTQRGGTVYCEPDSVVTYVTGTLQWTDLPFFFLRWSDAWDVISLDHFREKWNLANDRYFRKRYDRLGYRRHQAFLKPLLRRYFGNAATVLMPRVIPLERAVNRLISRRYLTLNGQPSITVIQPETRAIAHPIPVIMDSTTETGLTQPVPNQQPSYQQVP